MGPLLFSLHINNLVPINSRGKIIIIFSDSTVILFEVEFWSELKAIAEREFKIIKKWLQCNTLTLNRNHFRCNLQTSTLIKKLLLRKLKYLKIISATKLWTGV